jgi:hypothetical protein
LFKIFKFPALFFKKILKNQCEEKDMSDFLQIGGSSGLDTANMLVSDSVCGAAREPSNFI